MTHLYFVATPGRTLSLWTHADSAVWNTYDYATGAGFESHFASQGGTKLDFVEELAGFYRVDNLAVPPIGRFVVVCPEEIDFSGYWIHTFEEASEIVDLAASYDHDIYVVQDADHNWVQARPEFPLVLPYDKFIGYEITDIADLSGSSDIPDFKIDVLSNLVGDDISNIRIYTESEELIPDASYTMTLWKNWARPKNSYPYTDPKEAAVTIRIVQLLTEPTVPEISYDTLDAITVTFPGFSNLAMLDKVADIYGPHEITVEGAPDGLDVQVAQLITFDGQPTGSVGAREDIELTIKPERALEEPNYELTLTFTFHGTHEIYEDIEQTVHFQINNLYVEEVAEVVVEEDEEVVVEETTSFESAGATCDNLQVEFANKLNYEQYYNVPLWAANDPSADFESTIIIEVPTIDYTIDADCKAEFTAEFEVIGANDFPTEWYFLNQERGEVTLDASASFFERLQNNRLVLMYLYAQIVDSNDPDVVLVEDIFDFSILFEVTEEFGEVLFTDENGVEQVLDGELVKELAEGGDLDEVEDGDLDEVKDEDDGEAEDGDNDEALEEESGSTAKNGATYEVDLSKYQRTNKVKDSDEAGSSTIVQKVKPKDPIKTIVDFASETGTISIKFSRPIILVLGDERRRRRLAQTYNTVEREQLSQLIKVDYVSNSEQGDQSTITQVSVQEATGSKIELRIVHSNPSAVSIDSVTPDQVSISFDSSVFVDPETDFKINGGELLLIELPRQIDPELLEVLESTLSSAGSAANTVGIGTTIVNVLLGTSLKMLWALINTLQFIVFFTDWNAQIPAMVVVILKDYLRGPALGEFIPYDWFSDQVEGVF